MGQLDTKFPGSQWTQQSRIAQYKDPWLGGARSAPRDAMGTGKPVVKGDIVTEFDNSVRESLFGIYQRLYETAPGKPLGYTENFFPRILKDRAGFLENTTRGRAIARRVDDLFEKKQAELGRVLTPEEETDIILKELTKGSGSKPLPPKAATENRRVITRLTEDEYQYFASPDEALENYIYTSNEVAAFRQMLGYGPGNAAQQVSKLTRDLFEAGEISWDDMKPLATILQARIGNGTKPMHGILRGLKNVFYATTLANPGSALVQTGDLGLSAVMNGIRPTVKALAKTIAKANKLPDIDATDTFDLVRATAEMADNKSMAATLQRMFTYSGFATVDKIGKNVNIQSTLNKARELAKRPDYITALEKQFGVGLFSRQEWDDVAKALRAGKVTENVKFLTWNALSDSQPISLSELPLKYLEKPNGRIFYAMKSYMLKQLDLVRKKGFDLLATPGRQREGAAFLMKYGAYLGMLNMGVEETRAYFLGRELDRGDSMLDDVALSALKGLGMSGYFMDQVEKAAASRDFTGLVEAMMSIDAVTHAVDIVGNAIKAVAPTEAMEDDPARRWEIVRNFPGFGPLLHNYWAEGNTAFNEWQEANADREDD